MAVCFAIPTAASFATAARCLNAWKARGYRTAFIYERSDLAALPADHRVQQVRHGGYAASVNRLIASVLKAMPDCSIVVTGGDDTFPVTGLTAPELETQFFARFPDSLGVMQPTGDPWCGSRGPDGRRSNEISAQSPWLGRAFCERAYQGHGPYWPQYFHYFADTELQAVAERLKVFWQRPEIADYHDNWKRRGAPRPKYLYEARQRRTNDEDLFLARRAGGFPGHQLRKR
jgi:hypothetical protein